PDRPAVVVRELTKKFEEFNRGSLDDLAVHFDQNGPIKGEICFYIAGNDAPVTEATMLQDALEEMSLKDQVDWWMGQKDLSTKDAIKQVAKQTGVNKRTCTQLTTKSRRLYDSISHSADMFSCWHRHFSDCAKEFGG